MASNAETRLPEKEKGQEIVCDFNNCLFNPYEENDSMSKEKVLGLGDSTGEWDSLPLTCH